MTTAASDVGTAFRRPEEHLYTVACAAMLVFGVVLSLPGTIVGLPDVVAQFDLTLAARGTLISTLFFGMLIGCLVGGPIVDAVGQRTSLASSTAMTAASMMLFAFASTFTAAGAALVAVGVGCSGMNISANALSSDLFPDERGRRMNGIAIMVGVGGLLMPAATALLTMLVSWRAVVFGAGIAALLVAAAVSRVTAPPRGPKHHWIDASRQILRQPEFAAVGVLVLLGAANENLMAGWTSTYLNAEGFSPGASTWLLSSHWLGLIVGRSVLSARVERRKSGAIAVCALVGAAIIAAFITVPLHWVLAAAPFAIGAAIGIIVPTSLALGGERLQGNAGTLFGLLLTMAQVGGMTAPAIVGALAERWSIRVGLSLLVVNSLAIVAVAWRAGRR